MKRSSVFLFALLFSFPIIFTAGNVQSNSAEASGLNRFVVWGEEEILGKGEIFFKRSTDNGATWKASVNLSTNAGNSILPQIATSDTKVYVAWTQENSAGTTTDIMFRRSTNDGVTWGPKVKLSSSGDVSNQFLAMQMLASGSNVYVVWFEFAPIFPDIMFRRSTDGGVTWGSITNLSNNSGGSFEPRIFVSGTNIYVVWLDGTSGLRDIFFRRSTNGGVSWDAAINLSNTSTDSENQQIFASGSNVHVVWEDGTFGARDIFFRRSTNGGVSWNSVVNVSSNAGASVFPNITGSGTNVFVAWSQENSAGTTRDIMFRKATNNGASWGAKIKISTNGEASHGWAPEVSASGSNVFVSWEDSGDVVFRRSTNSGGTWGSVVNLSKNTGGFASMMSVAGSNLFVVWHDFGLSSDVLLTRSTDNGATWKAAKNLSNTETFSGGPAQVTA